MENKDLRFLQKFSAHSYDLGKMVTLKVMSRNTWGQIFFFFKMALGGKNSANSKLGISTQISQ